jgi:hypothetical protein
MENFWTDEMVFKLVSEKFNPNSTNTRESGIIMYNVIKDFKESMLALDIAPPTSGSFGSFNSSSATISVSNASTSTVYAPEGFFSTPELIDHYITTDEITFVYKRYSMVSSYVYPAQNPPPQIFKVVYSRHDGSEKQTFGNYIPATPESYEFD